MNSKRSFDDSEYGTITPYILEHKHGPSERRSNSKRFHGNKGGETQSAEDTLHHLIFLVGQKSSSSLSDNIRNLAKVLLSESSKPYFDALLATIIECVSEMAWKPRIYSSIVGLLNLQDPAMVSEKFIPLLLDSMDKFISNGSWSKFTLSLRFLADLVTVNVVNDLSFLHSIEPLIDFIEQCSNDPSREKAKFYFLYSILSSFLWNGSVLLRQNEGVFRTLLVRIGNIMLEIKSASPSLEQSGSGVPRFFSFDILLELYSFFTNMDNWTVLHTLLTCRIT